MRGTKPTTVRKTTGWGINTADTDIVSADWARSPTGHGDAGYHALYVPVSPPSGHGNVSPPPGEAVTPLSRAGVNGSVFSYAVVRLIGVALLGRCKTLTCDWLHHRTAHAGLATAVHLWTLKPRIARHIVRRWPSRALQQGASLPFAVCGTPPGVREAAGSSSLATLQQSRHPRRHGPLRHAVAA